MATLSATLGNLDDPDDMKIRCRQTFDEVDDILVRSGSFIAGPFIFLQI